MPTNHPAPIRPVSAFMIAAVLSVSAAASCGSALDNVLDGFPVTVIAPEFPAAWSGADAWELLCSGPGSTPRRARLLPGQRLGLVLSRTAPAAIECRPAFGRFLGLPLGSLWPLDAREDGSLAPDARGGYAAALAAALFRGGLDPGFDLPRFAREAERRMADPWDRDPAGFAPEVAAGRFRADWLGQPERFAFTVGGLPCALAPDSPWGTALVPDPDGSATGSMAAGVRRWMGGGYCLAVSMDGEGSFAWALAGPDPADGADPAAGTLTVKALPSPSRLSSDTRPPWARVMCLTMARPSPVPPSSLPRARSSR